MLLIVALLVSLADNLGAITFLAFNITLSALFEVILHAIKRQVHLATLVNTFECSIPQQALDSFASSFEFTSSERLLAVLARFLEISRVG